MSQRVLIVFFSLTGNTEGLARDLAAALPAGHWELEALREPAPRRGWRGIVRCVRDSIARRTPPIVAPRNPARDYDVVLVGTPIWMGRISGPVRTYLSGERLGNARLGLFVTSGGPLTAATRADIAAACRQDGVPLLQFRTREVHDVARVDEFLQATGIVPRAGSTESRPATFAAGQAAA